MSPKVSPQLEKMLVEASPTATLKLQILLDTAASQAVMDDAVRGIDGISSPGEPVELLRNSRMVFCAVRAARVPKVAEIPGVIWIDAQREAPLESIMDE